MKSIQKILFVCLAVFATALISTAFTEKQVNPGGEKSAEQNKEKAPAFSVTSVEGEKFSLKKSLEEEKPTVIYFTASWCPMCAKNWPALSEVYPEYKDKLNLISISIDPTDDKEVMEKLSKQKGFSYPVAPGNPKVMVDFGVKSQATTVGIDKNGYIAFRKNKTVLSADDYRELFDKLTKQ